MSPGAGPARTDETGAAAGAWLDHIGIVVETFDGLAEVFRDALGLPVTGPEPVPELAMEILWVGIGGTQLQFIRPLRDDTGAARVLRERGPGLHHIGVGVPDIEAAMGLLATRGVALRDKVPRPGARSARVAFIDPAAAAGTEVELVETAR